MGGTKDPEKGGGSYTARPSKEPQEEGTTRDHDEEQVERTGEGDGAEPVEGGDRTGSGG
jgi:hypothetical protein